MPFLATTRKGRVMCQKDLSEATEAVLSAYEAIKGEADLYQACRELDAAAGKLQRVSTFMAVEFAGPLPSGVIVYRDESDEELPF